ncbi:MAG: hypothetical protein C5B49_11880 [Bdellovibrio sp.]|nr:MAG: hypothetical protein C5B49_11880 [Bdellovibrio sp.]
MSGGHRAGYVNQKGRAAGPFSYNDIQSLVHQGNLRGHELIYREGADEWRRAYDWLELAELFLETQDQGSFSRLFQIPDEVQAREDQWVLLAREDDEQEVRFRQKGPYSTDEIRRLLAEEKVKPTDHVWKKGHHKWIPLVQIPDFHYRNLKMTLETRERLQRVETMPAIVEISMPDEDTVTVTATATLELLAPPEGNVQPALEVNVQSESQLRDAGHVPLLKRSPWAVWTPFLAVVLLVLFGVGIWATLFRSRGP